MIECVFTLDYEIYGNGTGSLHDLVYEPTERLRDVFRRWSSPCVIFVEVMELQKIEAYKTDPAFNQVKEQIRQLHEEGCEIGLHLHPQWSNARFEQGQWVLDESEYNLCVLPHARIARIVADSISYLRLLLNQPQFTPISFRAGNWLFQPTGTVASILADNGIKVDSSVFKGGLQHNHTLDYRPSVKNGYFWPFGKDVNEPDQSGALIEFPIHTELVPFWKMASKKRLSLGAGAGIRRQSAGQKLNRIRDFMRFQYPLKLDFCRMRLSEMVGLMSHVIREDRDDPASLRPLVAIGHTKDLMDVETLESFLSFLNANQIVVSTFRDIYPRVQKTTTRIHGSSTGEALYELK